MPALGVTFTGDTKNLDAAYVRAGNAAKKSADTQIAEMKRFVSEYDREVTRLKGGVTRIPMSMEMRGVQADVYRQRLADLAQREKDRDNSLTGSQVTRNTFGRTEQLAELRRKLLMGGSSADEARMMIREMKGLAPAVAAGAADGFWTRFIKNIKGHGSGGISQLIHVFRATFDSLASGMSPWRVMLQQGPQALQAFSQMGGSAALKFIMGFAAVAASLTAIIAAPFIFFKRVNDIAGRLAGFKLPDLSTQYISRLDRAAESWRKLRAAMRDTVDEYNSATAAARRLQEALGDRLSAQSQVDAINKDTEIARAQGNLQRIAEIEKRYIDLSIQRQRQKADAEKQIKAEEAAGLKKELAANEAAMAKIKLGSESAHRRVLDDAAEAAKKAREILQADRDKDADRSNSLGITNWLRDRMSNLGAGFRSGGLLASVANPVGGQQMTNDLINQENAAHAKDLELARQTVKQYNALLDAENARNIALEKRNKLQGDSETKAKRLAELNAEIADADQRRDAATANLQSIANAQKSKIDSGLLNAGRPAIELTANQRIGAYAMPMQITQIEIAKAHLGVTKQTNEVLTRMENLMKVNPSLSAQAAWEMINGPFK